MIKQQKKNAELVDRLPKLLRNPLHNEELHNVFSVIKMLVSDDADEARENEMCVDSL
jgi:hypothetical protein